MLLGMGGHLSQFFFNNTVVSTPHPSLYTELPMCTLPVSGLPEATTQPITGHLPLITTSYSARPSLIIQPIPFAVSGMRMCALMHKLGHRALTPEHAILMLNYCCKSKFPSKPTVVSDIINI